MDKKLNKWTKSKRIVASLLLTTTMLLAIAPVVHAEDSQTLATTETTTQARTEEVVTPDIVRYEGYSRDEVAERVANAHFSDSNKVIIVNREKFPDAISATNISQGRYPVLYTREGHVTDDTLELIQSMTLDEIYVLGGTLSINESVVEQLEEATDVEVTRIAGRSRYDANVSAVEENFAQANHVVIASGEVYSDALYGVSYANTIDAPVVLTNTNQLQASTVELLKDLGVEDATIIGGPLTVTDAVEKQLSDLGIEHNRIAGRNRYIGSAEVASAAYDNPENVVIASGEVFSDALISAPLAQKLDAPILLVRKDRMENVVEEYLTENKVDIENIYIQGGPLTIFPTNENRIEGLATYSVESGVLSFETLEKEDDTLLAGEREVTQAGKDGFEEIFYNVTLDDSGEVVSREEFHRETIEPVPEIIKIGTRVDIESISLSPTGLILEEEESYGLTATVLPENATNQNLVWSSSNEEVAIVGEEGTVTAQNAGETTITVSDSSGEITDHLVITVIAPTIESLEGLTDTVTQFDDYELPVSVSAVMSNGTTREILVNWDQSGVDTSTLGTVEVTGTLEGYDELVTLSITIEEYDPQLRTNAYSNITMNNLSQQISLSMNNFGDKSVSIDKIEIYERGNLYATYTPESLESSSIPTTVRPNGSWGMSIQYRFGLWLDGSYVKFYVTANDTPYEYEESLERN